MAPGAKALFFSYALRGLFGFAQGRLLKRRSSTVAEGMGKSARCLLVDAGSRFLSGFAGSE